MQRTIISLDPEDRAWLSRRAQVEHVPQTEVVRRALRLYRQNAEICGSQSFEELARITSGIRQGEDGLIAQQRLRDEWSER
jgi:hypothetical protein